MEKRLEKLIFDTRTVQKLDVIEIIGREEALPSA